MEVDKLVTDIAKALVDHPEGVVVNTIAGSKTNVIELRVERGDLGKIIGRHGRTADAIRTIVNAASKKAHRSTILEIVD